MSPLKLTWLGHASFMLQGERTVLFDPWIQGNPACPPRKGGAGPRKLSSFRKVDFICVTHGHDDHLGDALELCRRTRAKLITTPEIAIYAGRHGIEYDVGSIPLNYGGAYRTRDVEVTMVAALHTSEILGEEFRKDGTVMPGAGACGFVVRLAGAPIVYYGGDTGVFGDMALIRRLYAPQVAILPVGGKYTMGLREAAYAAQLLVPRVFIPIHYDTFPNQKADTEQLKRLIAVSAPDTEVIVLKPGETYRMKG